MATAAATEIEIQHFRRISRRCGFTATFLFGAVIVLVMTMLGVVILRGSAMGEPRVIRLGLSWSPAIGYLWALWTLRGMFQALARDGLTFQPAVIRALHRIGAALALGAALTLLEAPAAFFLTGSNSPSSGFAMLNVPALTLLVTSMALAVLAQMLERGARLEAEAAGLKAVLEDFI